MIERTKVSFDSGGVQCVGHLHHPARVRGAAPCVVLGTGFGGTQDTPSIRAAAEAFAAGGLAALTFDHRSFGESDGEPRQVIRLADQHADLRAAIRFVRARPDVDPKRIALWGTSLGGGHVIVVAADDPGIAAVVAQVPFNGFPKKVEGRSTAATLRLLRAIAKDAVRGRLGLSPAYIPAVGSPGELAVMASAHAEQTIRALRSDHWRNEIAPRALLEMMRYKPGDVAQRLAMPLQVCIAENDREAPPELARELAYRAPHAEVKSYPVAHFDFYREDVRARVLDDQLAFLRRHLMATRSSTEPTT